MSHTGRRRLLSLLLLSAALWLFAGCRSFEPGLVVAPPGDPGSQRLTFAGKTIDWRIEGEVLTVSFPVRERGWTALVLGGGIGLAGGDVIIVRSTLAGSEAVDAFVEEPFSAVPDARLGGGNQLRLVSVADGRAVVTKPIAGDEWDLPIGQGELFRLVLAEGFLGVDSFPLLSMIQTEIEL